MNPDKFPDMVNEKAEMEDRDKLAKFAVELDLVPLETNIKNLQSMIVTSSSKLQESKPLTAWQPPDKGHIYNEALRYQGETFAHNENIFEWDNLRRICWEEEED